MNIWTISQKSADYAATLNLAVSLPTAAATVPAISAGGIPNAASVAPGSWISIYGTNLAVTTHALTSSDIVNNLVPATLAGVSVQMDGKAAFIDYVSPTQINVLSPGDVNTGSVSIAVTNAAGTSATASATLQPLLPGLFMLGDYVAAVRASDNTIVNGTGVAISGYTTRAAANASDVLELYGTGFGPAPGAPATGTVFSSAYPVINTVTVTIGDIPVVSFAGLTAPGLYQINVTVPAGLSAGDHPILASVGGFRSQSSALLKIAA